MHPGMEQETTKHGLGSACLAEAHDRKARGAELLFILRDNMDRENKKYLAFRDLLFFRIRRGWTLRELGQITGLSAATLWRLERGVIRPSPRSLLLLQQALNLSSEQLTALFEEAPSGSSPWLAAGR